MRNPEKLRAGVRLRIEQGLVLLRYGGVPSVACTLLDLSDGGCKCLAPLGALEPQSAASWRRIIMPTRPIALELSCPPHLTQFFCDAEVRGVEELEGGLELGMRFHNLEPR